MAKKKKSKEEPRSRWLRTFIATPEFRKVAAVALILIGFLSASLWVQHVVARNRIITAHDLDLETLPVWLGKAARQDVRGLLSSDDHPMFSSGLVDQVGKSLSRLPWVRKVLRVVRDTEKGVQFRLVIRQPVAFVEANGSRRLVDRDGFILPKRYFREGMAGLPTLKGAASQEIQVFSNRINGEPISHGLSVAQELHQARIIERIPGLIIDVSNVDGRLDPTRSEVLLLSEPTRTVFHWGRAPVSRRPKNPAARKIQFILKQLEMDPSLKSLDEVKLGYKDFFWKARS